MALARPWASSAWSLWSLQLIARPLASAAAWYSGAAAWLAICRAVAVSPPGTGCPGAAVSPLTLSSRCAAAVMSGGPLSAATSASAARLHAAWSQAAIAASRSAATLSTLGTLGTLAGERSGVMTGLLRVCNQKA